MSEIITWLFGTKAGMGVLIFGGMALFLVIAFLLERRTGKMYHEHEKPSKDDDSFLSFFRLDDDDDK